MNVEDGQVTVLTHFYRGELGRMMIWRERLDRTTNWAIIAVTAIVSYVWSHEAFMHVALLLGNAVLYLLLMIEARRYLFYDGYRARVRMLEVYWVLPHVEQKGPTDDATWRRVLREDLAEPTLKISIWEALNRRLSRNYIWLFIILFAAWLLKVVIGEHSLAPTPEGLAIGVAVGLFYVYLLFLLALGWRRREASGEFRKRQEGDESPWTL